MQWQQAISEVRTLGVSGAGDVEVSDVQYDSRRVRAGHVFVAMRGETTDGNRYVEAALTAGASAVVTDSRDVFEQLSAAQPDWPVALVEHGRRGLAEISAAVLGHPERRLKISAVTGTNGKTTTAFLLMQLLRSVGRKCLLIGTIETRLGDEVRASEHTTPESRDLYALFAEGVRAGCTEVVMEASSHALAQERVWGLPVDVAIFTNLTQDHLDFHGTMEEYARAKARLFEGVGAAAPRVAVIREVDEHGAMMRRAFGGQTTMMYGEGRGEFRAEAVQYTLGETRFRFVTPAGDVWVRSPLSGRVNVENLLAAMCAAMARGLTLEQIALGVEATEQVPGRFQVVPGSRESGITVVVDYAHTDDALTNLIVLARESAVHTGGRVITLFGCGGDRDKTKRPKMGRAAGEGSDLVIVTSDNPRSEDPMAIIVAAVAGVRETAAWYQVEPDRRAAIEMAIREARPGDIVLLAGKGHEKTQVFADHTMPFDDVAEAEKVLREVMV